MAQTIAYLDCYSGISGDMFLGAMLDAGLSFDLLKNELAKLPIPGYELTVEPFADKGIGGMRFAVNMSEQTQPTRHLSDITALLHASSLSPHVRDTTLAIFQCLAEAEATIHGTSIEEVHFHEVGAIDAIIDVTGAAIAVDALGITQLYASPLPLTHGHVKTAHGLLPVPAPATLEILRRVSAPWKPSLAEGELVTPTGAAILATLARFQTPAIAIERIGYGFGQKQFPWPNCLRLCIGQAQGMSHAANELQELPDTDWITVIECNIDQMSGELLGGLMEQLFATGALDVNYTPMQMKKNRPAVRITVLCPVEEGDTLAHALLRETSTLGVRMQQMQRLKAQRTSERIETPLGPMLVKVKRLGAHILSAAPEYEDCQRIAQEQHLPLDQVYEVAQPVLASHIKHKRE